jgi:23S rRNA (guanosine2251-2'-O)-methyltransferase
MTVKSISSWSDFVMVSSEMQNLIGIHAVNAALTSAPHNVRLLSVAQETRNRRVDELVALAKKCDIPIQTLARSKLDKQCHGERHQDVIALFEPSNIHSEKEIDSLLAAIEGHPLILVLDGIQDPQNLGACLRTAEAAGVNFVVLPKDHSAPLSAATRRAASGAAEVLDLVVVSNLARVLRKLKEAGIWLAATTDQADQDIYSADLSGPLALVMGNEGQGMRKLTLQHCDYMVRIPMYGTVSSLNVSVATAIGIYEIIRQRRSA